MSKLEDILGTSLLGVANSYNDGDVPPLEDELKEDVLDTKQAIKDLMLELIGSDATFTEIYGDDYRNNYGYNEEQVRDAAQWLQRRLRKKIEEL